MIVSDAARHDLISEQSELEQRAELWRESRCIGLDTEFIRTRTFFPRLGLIQVSDREGCVLVDAVAIEDWTPLARVLESAEVGKILHSPSEDFEVFLGELGVLPLPLFETQIAATLCGLGGGLGYQKLVLELFDVELEKGEQRSDWLRRPLTDSQRKYAAQDVEYLIAAQEDLASRLEDLGRAEWAMEEFERLVKSSLERLEPGRVFDRIKKSGLRRRRELTLLRLLVEWREARARRSDVPRGFVLRDEVLVELARRRPETAQDLKKVEGLAAGARRRSGDELLSLIHEVENMPAEELEPAPAPKVTVGRKSAAVEALRRELLRTAEELSLPPEFLAPRRVLEDVVRGVRAGRPALPELLEGWRREVVGERLLELALEHG